MDTSEDRVQSNATPAPSVAPPAPQPTAAPASAGPAPPLVPAGAGPAPPPAGAGAGPPPANGAHAPANPAVADPNFSFTEPPHPDNMVMPRLTGGGTCMFVPIIIGLGVGIAHSPAYVLILDLPIYYLLLW